MLAGEEKEEEEEEGLTMELYCSTGRQDSLPHSLLWCRWNSTATCRCQVSGVRCHRAEKSAWVFPEPKEQVKYVP